jgi:hypothetical protein
MLLSMNKQEAAEFLGERPGAIGRKTLLTVT